MLTLRNPLDNAHTENAGIRTGGLMGHPARQPPEPAPRSTPRPSLPPPPGAGRRRRRRAAHSRGHPRRQAHRAGRTIDEEKPRDAAEPGEPE